MVLHFFLIAGFVLPKEKQLDLHILMETSNSITPVEFNAQLEFVKNMVKKLNVGLKNVRIGLTTYGEKVENRFFMKKYTTHQDIITAINSIQYSYG